jgi:hypothetical protein
MMRDAFRPASAPVNEIRVLTSSNEVNVRATSVSVALPLTAGAYCTRDRPSVIHEVRRHLHH